MSRFGLLVFDLDGTLADTQYDLAESVNRTREHYGLPRQDVPTIRSYVGNGIAQLLALALPHLSEDELAGAVAFFRQYYGAHLLDKTELYPGIRGLLDAARASRRVKLAVLTNKSEAFSRDILTGLGIIGLFEIVWGGDTGPQRKPSPEPLLNIIGKLRAETASTLMIGDSPNDVLSARAAGAQSCAAGWGYTPEAELRALKPGFFASAPADLFGII